MQVFEYTDWNFSSSRTSPEVGLWIAEREIQKRNIWRKTLCALCEYPACAQPALGLHHGWVHSPCLLTNPSFCSAKIALGLTFSKEKRALEKNSANLLLPFRGGWLPSCASWAPFTGASIPTHPFSELMPEALHRCSQYNTDDPQKS